MVSLIRFDSVEAADTTADTSHILFLAASESTEIRTEFPCSTLLIKIVDSVIDNLSVLLIVSARTTITYAMMGSIVVKALPSQHI